MPAKLITERVAAPFAGAGVNRDAGTISGVLLCGTVSSNGRDYPVAVFRRDYARYEGRPVNCDHGRDATVDRRFGWFTSVRPGSDGRPRGTLHCLKSHPMYERVMEAAERNPALFGFSHVAMCQTRLANGREVVESIDAVESIDLVAEPATTKGLFEGKGMSLTVRRLCEALVRHPWTRSAQVRPLKRLGEMDGMDTAPSGVAAPPPDDADPSASVKSAFCSAIMAVVTRALDGDEDPKEALRKIKEMIASHDRMKSDPDEADDDETADADTDTDSDYEAGSGDDTAPPGAEGRRVLGPALREARTICESIGFARAALDDLILVAAVPRASRESLARRLKEASAPERPTSAGRGRLSEDVLATTHRGARPDAPPVTDPKAFARLVESSNN
ncbi:hypothetical protein [Frigoriglobus tundricola]|uniref:Uncharacterized protein n=1 Tax=Frigoriglobus tundricola TaxID=2774151 RepID=A0A6M5YYZ6_9BACT|nr:hypothetical protein [Frigoriglobus tundricola]QJW98676.1 hypothetical protein FTUN_6271 [Frigoriglobus tundricola]